MPFFYKHIVPTGLKRCTTGEKHIEKDASVKLMFYKKLFSTSRELVKKEKNMAKKIVHWKLGVCIWPL